MMAAASYQIDRDPTQAWSSRLLLQAAKLGDTAAVETLLAEGANVNAATSEGNTPLMMAASSGQLAVIRLLQERGAVINQRRSDGFSALTLAVFFGHEDVVRELLDLGADLNAPRSRGEMTPEMWATARGFPVIAELLKKSREQIQPRENSNITEASPAAKPESLTTALSSDLQDTTDPDEFFEGIRRVGERKWTGIAMSDIKPPDETADVDDFFEEGIRKVGQTNWTRTASEAAPQEHSADAVEFFEFVRQVSQTADSCGAPEAAPSVRPADPDEFFEVGIRKVGQTEWASTLSTAGQESANDDEFFEEGIRRVGQTKWTTEISTIGRALEKEVGDERIKKPAKSEKLAASRAVTGYDQTADRDGFSGEGIRRVGQTSWNTAGPSKATEYYPKVSAGSYSPLSTLSERLGWRSKDLKLMGILLVVLFTAGMITFVQLRQHESQPASEVPAAAAEQESSIASQQENQDAPAAQGSTAAIEPVKAAVTEQAESVVTEQTPPAPAPSIVAEPTPDNRVAAASIPTPLVKESSPTVGNPDIAKSLASNRRPKIASPPPSNPRPKRAIRTGKKAEPVEETSAPAAITIVPSQAPKRAVSIPAVSQPQPATLIEGSSNKKKVIQWP